MKTLSMEKTVTVLRDGYIPYIIKYKELEVDLVEDTQIEVKFPRGMYKSRMKHLEKLGYSLVSWSREPTEEDPIWAPYRGIFTRE